MSNKVKKSLIISIVIISVVSLIGILLCNFFTSVISIGLVSLISKIIIISIVAIIDLFIILTFFLYWWSDVKWTQCQNWYKRKKSKYFKRR